MVNHQRGFLNTNVALQRTEQNYGDVDGAACYYGITAAIVVVSYCCCFIWLMLPFHLVDADGGNDDDADDR